MGVNKVIIGGETVVDLTGDTATASKVLNGFTFHDNSGTERTGTCEFDVDSTDATATVGEILETKTAYGRGTKLVGSMKNNGSATGTISTKAGQYTIAEGYHDGGGKVGISAAEQAKIVAGNIKQNVTILGVKGTYTGEGVNMQSKEATPTFSEQTIQPDSGYDGLSTVTVKAIPRTDVANSAGGTTVTIG